MDIAHATIGVGTLLATPPPQTVLVDAEMPLVDFLAEAGVRHVLQPVFHEAWQIFNLYLSKFLRRIAHAVQSHLVLISSLPPVKTVMHACHKITTIFTDTHPFVSIAHTHLASVLFHVL